MVVAPALVAGLVEYFALLLLLLVLPDKVVVELVQNVVPFDYCFGQDYADVAAETVDDLLQPQEELDAVVKPTAIDDV